MADCKKKQNVCLLQEIILLQFTRAVRKIASSQLIFAHNKVLPSYIHTGRTSYEHEISLHEYTSELQHNFLKSYFPVVF